jgi:preprotein translocase subunit SecF
MMDKIKEIYEKQYHYLIWIPIFIVLLSMSQIAYQTYTTGDFIHKGVSLKGGLTVKLMEPGLNEAEVLSALQKEFPKADLEVRTLSSSGQNLGLSAKIDLDISDEAEITRFNQVLLKTAPTLTKADIEANTQAISPTLGNSFFKATLQAMFVSFIFMALVVWFYFKIPIPSLAVILSAFCDIVVTIAVTNIMGMKISTAGIAAFLMLIGYSVDTDILLTTYMLRAKEGEKLVQSVFKAMKTGWMMSGTTLAAAMVGIYFTMSPDIKQILIIITIGLFADQIMTWIQNAGILMWYFNRVNKKKAAQHV